jgi:hypothetical protein
LIKKHLSHYQHCEEQLKAFEKKIWISICVTTISFSKSDFYPFQKSRHRDFFNICHTVIRTSSKYNNLSLKLLPIIYSALFFIVFIINLLFFYILLKYS